MKCWMLVIGGINDVSERMAIELAHATFGFHPTNPLSVTTKELADVFRPLILTEVDDWVNWDVENGRIGYLFKIKPSQEMLVRLGTLFMEVFKGCTVELQSGVYNKKV